MDLHAEQIVLYGGTEGVRDNGGLASAIAVPQSSFGGEYLYPTVWDMAAAYAFNLAESQAFLDGNKRTALNAALMFLALNGHNLDDPHGRLYEAMVQIGRHELDKDGFATLLRRLAGLTAD
jgi:death-on-curing protein